jgi:hypothetical protein
MRLEKRTEPERSFPSPPRTSLRSALEVRFVSCRCTSLISIIVVGPSLPALVRRSVAYGIPTCARLPVIIGSHGATAGSHGSQKLWPPSARRVVIGWASSCAQLLCVTVFPSCPRSFAHICFVLVTSSAFYAQWSDPLLRASYAFCS